MNNIILIGFMGAGKTSIGTRYARERNLPFMDTDQEIERIEGMTVAEIFDQFGEKGFRHRETELLKKLIGQTEHTIICVGGGLPLNEENRRLLKQLGNVIFLRVGKEIVLGRLEGDTSRPLLQGENVSQKVGELLKLRNPIYQSAADLIIDVDHKNYPNILYEIERYINETTSH